MFDARFIASDHGDATHFPATPAVPHASLLGMTFPAQPSAQALNLTILAVAALLFLPVAASSQATPSSEDVPHHRPPPEPQPGPRPHLRRHLARRRQPRLDRQRLPRLRTPPHRHRPRRLRAGRCLGRVLSPDTIGDVTNNRPGACTASHPAWSPDGSQLAFLSDCSDANGSLQPSSQQNIFVWTLAVNNIKQVSHLHGELSTPSGRPTANPSPSSSSKTPPATPVPSTP